MICTGNHFPSPFSLHSFSPAIFSLTVTTLVRVIYVFSTSNAMPIEGDRNSPL